MACGALLDGTDPVRIGLPLDGWDLAVVDAEGNPVAEGESGELIIGGVGLARYLDPEKDAEKYAPMPTLGWDRAYRSGDVVRNDPLGLVFAGRADDQIKLGGRRIELGEIDEQLLRLPGVNQAAAAVRSTKSGNKLLVGYLTVDETYDATTAQELLRGRLPAALVPRLAVVDELPTRTSGKVDRDALPWPLPKTAHGRGRPERDPAVARRHLGRRAGRRRRPARRTTSSTSAAARSPPRRWSAASASATPRSSSATSTPTPASPPSPTRCPRWSAARRVSNRDVRPLPLKSQAGQLLALVPLRALAGLRWLSWLLLGSAIARPLLDLDWLPTTPVWVLILTTWFFLVPPGRMTLAALLARVVLRPRHPRRPPARRQDPPAHLARRAHPGRARRDVAGRRAVVPLLRAPARQRHRQGLRPAHAAAGHRAAHRRQGRGDRARGRPRRPLDRRRRHPRRRRSRSAPAPASAPAARSAPAPPSARTPRSRPARWSRASCPPASSGPARPPSAAASRRAAPGRTRRPVASPAPRRPGSVCTAPWRPSSPRCPRSRCWSAALVLLPAVRDADDLADAVRRRCRGCRSRRSSATPR